MTLSSRLRIWKARVGPARRLDAQLNVYNVDGMLVRPPERYEFVRFDPNNACNVHCVYCHNHRNDQKVATAQLQQFLQRILELRNFQLGCVMEPTLDDRLGDLLLEARRCPVGPTEQLILQTNGILLHMHDAGKLRDAQLTRLSVSIDSADPEVHRTLRGGTSLAKVQRNLRAFRTTCPEVEMHFITTVTRLNLASLDTLVQLGLDLGVSRFVMREVFYHPDNDVVDHGRMPDLVLEPGDYERMAEDLLSRFARQATFEFADGQRLAVAEAAMATDSLRRPPAG